MNLLKGFASTVYIFFLLTGCAQDISVQFPLHIPQSGESQLSSIQSLEIFVSVQDTRPLTLSDGSREAAFGVPMGNIQFQPDVRTIIKDVIMTELKNAGHKIVDRKEQIHFKAKITRFEVGTDTTPLYWDIIGNVKIEVEVISLSAPQFKKTYNSICKDRTYIWPGETLIKEVMQSCINNFANKIRRDKEVAQALKIKIKK